MRERTVVTVVALEVYAFILANVQAMGGVRTDEAKYLLDIPYPHPPLLRTAMSWTELLPFQEMFWRVLLATLLVQAVWLIWDMGRDLEFSKLMTLGGAWLLSTALVFQAGSIMMAPVTALQAAVLLWCTQRRDFVGPYAGLVALFWLGSLFTAYQAVLFYPILWLAFHRADVPFKRRVLYVFLPVALLALYTLTNPLAIATFMIHANEGVNAVSPGDRIAGVLRLWLTGGSVLISIAGTIGLLLSGSLNFFLSFLLVVAYNALSNPYPFYAILFTPLFVAGVHYLLRRLKSFESVPLLLIFMAGMVVSTALWLPSHKAGPARETMKAIKDLKKTGDIGMVGTFGHEWQYESPAPLRHFRIGDTSQLQAVVCLDWCAAPADRGWRLLPDTAVRVWVKQ